MARLNARWYNFSNRGQAWTHFWQDAAAAGGGGTAYALVADVGTFALSGSAVALKAALKLTAAPGAFTLSGSDVGLTYTPGGSPPATVRRYYHGRVAHIGAVRLSKRVYYVDE